MATRAEESMPTTQSPQEALEAVVREAVAPGADAADSGQYPRRALDALGAAGLLGLVSSAEAGGLGRGLGDAAAAVERAAQSCASTALVLTMHYCATAVIEATGDMATRRDIAAGRHVTTLAFSEVGSRSQFWVPL